MKTPGKLELYFSAFAKDIIGNAQPFNTPYGSKQMLYADWTASGRCYAPIEQRIRREVLPFVGNTHTSGSVTGTLMSEAYEVSKQLIKKHVNASKDDVLLFCGSGMTHAVNKLQRILGLKTPATSTTAPPVVFVTHMEHHSNHTSWLETIATVIIIPPCNNGNPDLAALSTLLEQYKNHPIKIAAVTACSNVTGIHTPSHQIAKLMHACGGRCFVDFACSAPYTSIDMHPAEKAACFDAIYFSPHKFLGGPGTPGVLIFNKELYHHPVPDQPGGGTLLYSNPWNGRTYLAGIEEREDGGTPPFLGAIKTAMCIRLKEAMGIDAMHAREKEIMDIVFDGFRSIRNARVLAGDQTNRLGIVSFTVDECHHYLFARLLNDRFGVQSRSGCSCAGTYGHWLLKIGMEKSHEILQSLSAGDLLVKPGWVRISIHPTMSNACVHELMDAIRSTASHWREWQNDYRCDHQAGEFVFTSEGQGKKILVESWFGL